jgi:hypothetical protein
MRSWAELVPKSFSTNVATPMAMANNNMYSDAALEEHNLSANQVKYFIVL